MIGKTIPGRFLTIYLGKVRNDYEIVTARDSDDSEKRFYIEGDQVIIMAKKAGKLKNTEELSKIELEEGESSVVEGIEDVKILLDRKKEKATKP